MATKHCASWEELPEQISPSGFGKRVLEGNSVLLVMVSVPSGTSADLTGCFWARLIERIGVHQRSPGYPEVERSAPSRS